MNEPHHLCAETGCTVILGGDDPFWYCEEHRPGHCRCGEPAVEDTFLCRKHLLLWRHQFGEGNPLGEEQAREDREEEFRRVVEEWEEERKYTGETLP